MRHINNKTMYQVKIDSCKLSIPLSKCTEISSELTDFFITQKTNISTGEVITSDKEARIPYTQTTDYGTYYKFWVENQISNQGSELFISIPVSYTHLTLPTILRV